VIVADFSGRLWRAIGVARKNTVQLLAVAVRRWTIEEWIATLLKNIGRDGLAESLPHIPLRIAVREQPLRMALTR
jgi:hypothetical protein